MKISESEMFNAAKDHYLGNLIEDSPELSISLDSFVGEQFSEFTRRKIRGRTIIYQSKGLKSDSLFFSFVNSPSNIEFCMKISMPYTLGTLMDEPMNLSMHLAHSVQLVTHAHYTAFMHEQERNRALNPIIEPLGVKIHISVLENPQNEPILKFPSIISFTKWIEQGSLDNYLRLNKLSLHEFLDKSSRLVEALDYMHSNQIIFCDLKPQNLFVDQGIIKISDFDCVYCPFIGNFNKSSEPFQGTRGFAATEQLFGHCNAYSPSTDVFGLAATLYYLISGEYPYKVSDDDSQNRLESCKPIDFKDLVPDAPEKLNSIFSKSFEIASNDRPLSILEFYHEVVDATRDFNPPLIFNKK